MSTAWKRGVWGRIAFFLDDGKAFNVQNKRAHDAHAAGNVDYNSWFYNKQH